MTVHHRSHAQPANRLELPQPDCYTNHYLVWKQRLPDAQSIVISDALPRCFLYPPDVRLCDSATTTILLHDAGPAAPVILRDIKIELLCKYTSSGQPECWTEHAAAAFEYGLWRGDGEPGIQLRIPESHPACNESIRLRSNADSSTDERRISKKGPASSAGCIWDTVYDSISKIRDAPAARPL